jgi:hypothetical protein
LTLPPRHRCRLDRLPASRLLLPRSGLERSDFVRWHKTDSFAQLAGSKIPSTSAAEALAAPALRAAQRPETGKGVVKSLLRAQPKKLGSSRFRRLAISD